MPLIEPLGFVFDHDAAIAEGWAHRPGCAALGALSSDVVVVAAGEVLRAERCPRACQRCSPAFVTVLDAASAPPQRT